MMDSVATSGKAKFWWAELKDNIFGEVKSSSLSEVTPASYSITNKTTAVYDSLVLYLTYNDNYYYGDTI